ncbi:hypothetical protein ACRFS9_001612 [Escherichia coli]
MIRLALNGEAVTSDRGVVYGQSGNDSPVCAAGVPCGLYCPNGGGMVGPAIGSGPS